MALLLFLMGWSGQSLLGVLGPAASGASTARGSGGQQPSVAGSASTPDSSLPRVQGRKATSPSGGEAGYLEAAQVTDLLHKIWLAEYRINDLLAEVHPERWKVEAAGRASFTVTLGTLRQELAALETWRTQFGERTDSLYLGYETFATMNAVLPRLDGVARGITENENTSLGAQYTQAENHLFDLQQTLEPYLGFLLRNQDKMLLAVQTNLAGCQKQLGFAMQGTAGPVKVIGHTPPTRPRTRHSRAARSKSKRSR